MSEQGGFLRVYSGYEKAYFANLIPKNPHVHFEHLNEHPYFDEKYNLFKFYYIFQVEGATVVVKILIYI